MYAQNKPDAPKELMDHRFLTLNTVVRVNQIEVARDQNEGTDERDIHTPERTIAFRQAIEDGFPGARITWAFSWRALHDTTYNYRKIRELVADYHHQYGDDVTFIPGAYFANAYNTTEQVNKDLHEGLAKVGEIVGKGYRPKSIVAGFLSAKNQQYLAEKEGIHVCQGNIWSQFSIDNQDGDGAVSYPFYPSKEHFCKPAQGKQDFIDCVNLDGWTVDFLAGRRAGFAEGFNSRMGVGPIETFGQYGQPKGLEEMMHATAIHFDKGFELNGFAWVTNCWELCLPYNPSELTKWLAAIKQRWPDVQLITQGEFGLLWRKHYKNNNFNYCFEETGSGIGGSDYDKRIRWFMNKHFRLALLNDRQGEGQETVIDFTRYDIKVQEPQEMTRKWSLLGEINQKQTRPQDKPVPLNQLSEESQNVIRRVYPDINNGNEKSDSPCIINIVNFIRQVEPRVEEYTDDVLYQTVVEQVKQLNQYQLPGTFLLQYDALINPKYQQLLKNELVPGSEIGAWWEITQPHVEAAGMQWRGRYPWDWHANVGFATGYTPEEREKLVDTYMEKFKSIFGKYPASVGSWFIDAHTLAYMYDKYHITASCNCKDQIGTDGYTLWGGYWNQAYYPSRKNAYMPAQNEAAQISVPIFRMLGSDPIYQYEHGLGGSSQGVITLEPVYTGKSGGGAVRPWVEWFLKTMTEEPHLAFNYLQAGQENSFTWSKMKDGLSIQIPLLDSLRKQNKVRIETLEASGRWFKEKFPVTPATAVTALTDDYRKNGNKTVWYNSRFYRANLMWEGKSFRFRDIHLFDERLESDYLTKAGASTQCIYTTLPVVDGFMWSAADNKAGLRIVDKQGNHPEVGAPRVSELSGNVLKVTFSSAQGETFTLLFYEDRFEVNCTPGKKEWALELTAQPSASLPFQSIKGKQIKAAFNGFEYGIECKTGTFESANRCVFRILPEKNKIAVNCSQRN
jgi:hypothetical protein